MSEAEGVTARSERVLRCSCQRTEKAEEIRQEAEPVPMGGRQRQLDDRDVDCDEAVHYAAQRDHVWRQSRRRIVCRAHQNAQR